MSPAEKRYLRSLILSGVKTFEREGLHHVEVQEKDLIGYPFSRLLNEVERYPKKRLYRDVASFPTESLNHSEVQERTLLDHPQRRLLNEVEHYPRTRLLRDLRSYPKEEALHLTDLNPAGLSFGSLQKAAKQDARQTNLLAAVKKQAVLEQIKKLGKPVEDPLSCESTSSEPFSVKELESARRSLQPSVIRGPIQPSLLRFARACLEPTSKVNNQISLSALVPVLGQKQSPFASVNSACETSFANFLTAISALLETAHNADPAKMLLEKHNGDLKAAINELVNASA
jgi:hypothetical protein